jgi:hypothetical protein
VALQDDLVTSAHKTAAWADYNNDGFLDLIIKDGIGKEGLGARLQLDSTGSLRTTATAIISLK